METRKRDEVEMGVDVTVKEGRKKRGKEEAEEVG